MHFRCIAMQEWKKCLKFTVHLLYYKWPVSVTYWSNKDFSDLLTYKKCDIFFYFWVVKHFVSLSIFQTFAKWPTQSLIMKWQPSKRMQMKLNPFWSHFSGCPSQWQWCHNIWTLRHICCCFGLIAARNNPASISVAPPLDRLSPHASFYLDLNGYLYSGWDSATQRWYSGQVFPRHLRRKFMHNGLIVAHSHM